MNKKEKKYSFLEAKEKIEAWCAYQERCHYDVHQKLYKYGLDEEDANALLSHLISCNFINEQRFADSFVSGKFRIKKWGKVKIRTHLNQKKVPLIIIDKAIDEIDDKEYLEQLYLLADKKWRTIKDTPFEKKVKVARYLSGKGYEFELIYNVLEKLLEEK